MINEWKKTRMKSSKAKTYFIKRINISIYCHKTCSRLLSRRQELKKKERRRHRIWLWERRRRERIEKKNQKRHRKEKQRRRKRQRRKKSFEKEFERFLTYERKKEQKSKHFLTSVMKERKQVLTTRKNRVKILIVDKNRRRKLREKKERWIRAIDFLHVDTNFNLIDSIIQKIINIVQDFDFAFQNRHSRKQRVYSRLQSCFHDFRFVDHVDQLFFQLQHVEHRKIRLRSWKIQIIVEVRSQNLTWRWRKRHFVWREIFHCWKIARRQNRNFFRQNKIITKMIVIAEKRNKKRERLFFKKRQISMNCEK